VLLRLWVLKESLLKAAGCGLVIDPQTVRLDTARLGAVLCGTSDTLTGVLPPCDRSYGRETLYRLRTFVIAGGVGAVALAADYGDGLPPVVQTDLAEVDLDRMLCRTSSA
jgi:hypothetical protein